MCCITTAFNIQCSYSPTHPTAGSIADLEEMDLSTKLAFLKARPVLKCMNKNEALAEHDATWRTNGLVVNTSGGKLAYRILSQRSFSGDCDPPSSDSTDSGTSGVQSGTADQQQQHCVRYTVDVMLNDHWTDERCGIDDTQM